MLRAAGFVVDGDAGALAFNDAGAGIFHKHVGGQREDLLARGHDLANGNFVQLQGAVNERLLEFGQQAHAAGGGGDELQFFRRMDGGALRHLDVEAAQDDGGRALEEAHRRTDHGHEDQHGRGHGHGESLGAAQRQGLGDQLPDQDVEVGDEGKAEGDGDDVGIEQGVGLGERQKAEPAEEDSGGERLAEPAKGQRAEGDAELDGGEKVVQVPLQAENGAGSGNAGGEHLLDACVANGDQGELGGHKEGVGQDEHGHGDKLQQGETVHLGVRIALQRSGVRDQKIRD